MVKARLKSKYSGPAHLWQMARIKEEAELKKDYGYKNKAEVWKMFSKLRNFRAQARRLIPKTGPQAKIEKDQLIGKLISLGLVKEGAQIEDVLALTIKDLFERRIQTLLVRKKLANTVKQARQFITHGHVLIGDKKITSPSHLVRIDEESLISFAGNSPLISEMHPERAAAKKDKEVKKTEKELAEEEKAEKEEEKVIKSLDV